MAVKTQAEYATHRGVSAMAVSRAVKKRRLDKCVIRDPSGRPLGISDFDLADREWEANSDYTDAPQRLAAALAVRDPSVTPDSGTGPGEVDILTATRDEKFWKAKQAELKFKESAGELVPATEVAEKVTGYILSCRTKLLGIATRARQSMPHLTVADIAKLDELVRDALAELGR